MPTGRITFAGGISSESIHAPQLPTSIPGVRGNGSPEYQPIQVKVAQPVVFPDYGTSLNSPGFYAAAGVTEIAKANFLSPSVQGHTAALASRQSLMFDPRNSPSRSQFSEGYTQPLQVFAASNTWQLAGPTDSPGTRAKQPNQKFVSPFSSLPIPVRMPWDI